MFYYVMLYLVVFSVVAFFNMLHFIYAGSSCEYELVKLLFAYFVSPDSFVNVNAFSSFYYVQTGVPIVVGEWSLATDNCAMWLNGLNDNGRCELCVVCVF